jgi:hypothetical protein
MSAGSDFSGVAQGGIGKGFAQGVQQGTDAYNKGVDRKAAQANTYLTQFIGPNLQNLSKGLPRPAPGAPQAEVDAWIKAEDARRRQQQLLLTQSEKYLKATGSPISAEEWAGLFYDPNSALSAEEWGNISKNYGKFSGADANVKKMQAELVKLDPTSEAFKVKKAEYDKYIADTGYADSWKAIYGVDYKEFVDSDDFTKAVRKDKVRSNDETYLTGIMSNAQDPNLRAQAAQLLQNGIQLDALDPKTGKSYRVGFDTAIDSEGLDNFINSGSPEGINSALQRILNMSEEQKASLSGGALNLWNDYQQFLTDPSQLKNGPNKTAFLGYKKVEQEVVQQANSIKLQNQTFTYGEEAYKQIQQQNKLLGINIGQAERENIWKFGALALEGNQAVRGSKSAFMDLLPADMSQADKDKLWEQSVEKPLTDFEAKQTLTVKTAQENLLSMTAGRVKDSTNSLITNINEGLFHLTDVFTTDAQGNRIVNTDSETYKNLQSIGINVTPAVLLAQAKESELNLAAKGTTRQQQLEQGAANLRLTEQNIENVTTQNRWAEKFNQQKWTAGNYANVIAAADSEVAGAKAKGQLSLLMGEIVKQNGVEVMDDPEFIKMFSGALGSDAAYAKAKIRLTANQVYEDKIRTNTLKTQDQTIIQGDKQITIMGQQITAQQNDEFDRMFKSPESIRAYLADPNKVAAIARAAGISPTHAMSVLTQLDTEKRTLNDLSIRQIRFSMYAQQQNIDLGVRSANLADARFVYDKNQTVADNKYREAVFNFNKRTQEADERYRNGRATAQDFQWLAGFNQGVYEYDTTTEEGRRRYEQDRNDALNQNEITNGFRSAEQNLAWNQWQDQKTFRDKSYNDDFLKDARDFAYRQQKDSVDAGLMNKQINSMYLTPLAGKINIVEGQLDLANKDLTTAVASRPGLDKLYSGGIKWTKGKDGFYVAELSNPAASEQFNMFKLNGGLAAVEAAYNRTKVLNEELEEGKGLYTQLIDQFTAGGSFGAGGIQTQQPIPQGQLTTKGTTPTKTDLKAYQQTAPTKQGAAIASAWNSAVSGGMSKTYSNITTEGYCTTAIQAVLGTVANVPGGMPTGGTEGANGFMKGIIQKGATMFTGTGANGSVSVNDISKLPDGTLLFQKDGTTMGHVAMVVGGVVVQNSGYKDNKLSGAIGTMAFKDFVTARDTQTYAVQIPDKWYKGGVGPNGAAVSVATPGGTTPATKTTPTTKTTTPTTGVGTVGKSPYSSSDGNFTPALPKVAEYISKNITATGGVSIKANDKDQTGLTLKVGEGRYARITSDAVALNAIGIIGGQFGIHTLRTDGTDFAKAAKASPVEAAAIFATQLKNAGFTGDIGRYVNMYFRKKGWIK